MKQEELAERTLPGTLRDEVHEVPRRDAEESGHRSIGLDLSGLGEVPLPPAQVPLGGGQLVGDLGLVQAQRLAPLLDRLSEGESLACHMVSLWRTIDDGRPAMRLWDARKSLVE